MAVPPPTPDEVRMVSILDGDTILVKGYGDPFQVRLACIDAPEIRQRNAGPAARSTLQHLLREAGWVTLKKRRQASDGMEAAEVIPQGLAVPVNLTLVQNGMVFLDRDSENGCDQDRYREAEGQARSKNLGVWGHSLGYDLMFPWDYRACVSSGACR